MKYRYGLVCLLYIAQCYASVGWVHTKDMLAGSQAQCKVLLPSVLPGKKSQQYYLNYQKNAEGCMASIDYTKNCQGAHYCNAGVVIATKNTKNDKHSQKYYYQKGEAKGDYFRPSLQWSQGNIHYTLIWDAPKSALLKMADTMRDQSAK